MVHLQNRFVCFPLKHFFLFFFVALTRLRTTDWILEAQSGSRCGSFNCQVTILRQPPMCSAAATPVGSFLTCLTIAPNR